MPPPFSPLTRQVAGRGSDAWIIHGKALRAREVGGDVIVLSVGDPDFDTPAFITDAAVDALRGGDSHYTTMQGRQRLRQAIADRHSRRTGEEAGPDNVMITSGAQNALYFTAACLVGPGDHVVGARTRLRHLSRHLRGGGRRGLLCRDAARERLPPGRGGAGGGDPAADQGHPLRQSQQPHGGDAERERDRRHRRHRRAPRPLDRRRRGLWRPGLRGFVRADGVGAARARPHRQHQQPVQVARHDRLAARLARRADDR